MSPVSSSTKSVVQRFLLKSEKSRKSCKNENEKKKEKQNGETRSSPKLFFIIHAQKQKLCKTLFKNLKIKYISLF